MEPRSPTRPVAAEGAPPEAAGPLLIIFGGLPGTGKTTLARALSIAHGAVFLRVDSIEQAILRSSLRPPRVEEAGYLVAYTVAEDNLRLGRTVVADSVNPLRITREGWRGVAERAGAPRRGVEVVCSDPDEHRQRVETRAADIPGLVPPDWSAVINRAYEPWPEALHIDTAGRRVDDCLAELAARLAIA